jgi:hypothetical protein
MGNARKYDVVELLELLRGGASEGRMTMPVETTPPGRDPIENPLSILESKEATLGGNDRERLF